MNKKIPALILLMWLFAAQKASSQLNISGAQFFIESGAEVSVQGDLTSTVDILGPGKIILNGTANQNINTGGFIIPKLELNNTANVTLTGNTKISDSLLFTNGKILTGNFNLNLADTTGVVGMGAGKFVETNGTGKVIKELASNVTSAEIPVGAGNDYRPAFITTVGTYSNASVGVKVLGAADPNRPPSLSDYIKTYWPVTRTGITGTLTVAGQYMDADITGIETNLRGYYYNGTTTDWSSAGSANDAATNRVSSSIAANGDLYAMDKFDLLKTKVFLQGAYNTTTGVMNDGLRTAGYLPNADPYRTAPYTSNFTHVNNAINEAVIGTPFANQTSTNDNIVDWVFLELRSTAVSPGNTVLQTRSALIQRDGDIVDVDGFSPVTFNNVPSANYTVAVRHRNHLGLSTDPATFTPALSETKSTASLADLSSATDAQLYGPAGAYGIAGGKNVLWAGNVNGNGFIRYQGSNGPLGPNDRVVLLQDLSDNEANVLTGYRRGDVNLNTFTRYQGSNGPPPAGLNDRLFLLQQALGNIEITVRAQSLPN